VACRDRRIAHPGARRPGEDESLAALRCAKACVLGSATTIGASSSGVTASSPEAAGDVRMKATSMRFCRNRPISALPRHSSSVTSTIGQASWNVRIARGTTAWKAAGRHGASVAAEDQPAQERGRPAAATVGAGAGVGVRLGAEAAAGVAKSGLAA